VKHLINRQKFVAKGTGSPQIKSNQVVEKDIRECGLDKVVVGTLKPNIS